MWRFLTILFSVLWLSAFGLHEIAMSRQSVTIQVAPSRIDWRYLPGDTVEFVVKVMQYGHDLTEGELHYEIKPEQMSPIAKGKLELTGTTYRLTATMDAPGFLRCHIRVTVDGVAYHEFATAAFQPEDIVPFTDMPNDFDEYWAQAKKELQQVPLNPTISLIPEYSTQDINTYHIGLPNVQGKIYGILCVPKDTIGKKYPAMLRLPGAGVRSYSGERKRAQLGMITLYIGIHGIPVNLPDELYIALKSGILKNYPYYHLNDRDAYYYRRVILGCLRAVDFIYSLQAFDGERLLVYGGSQGGALTMMTAALDDRVKAIAVAYPALCDLQGYLNGRAGGWPHFYRDARKYHPDEVRTTTYFDVVNFARKLKVPGFYTWGFNDNVCPPTSMYAAYNVISAPKKLHTVPDSRHFRYPEQQEKINQWMYKKLGL